MHQARPTSIDLKSAVIDRARISQDRLTMSQTTPVAPGSADQSNQSYPKSMDTESIEHECTRLDRHRLTRIRPKSIVPGSSVID